MNDAPAPHTRYHAFDSLRAVMMLLGLVLHACQYYVTIPLFPGFDFRDVRTSGLAGLTFFGIHTFRMQTFFAMAGFFAALLCDRRGVRGMWSNRMKRVGLPLLVGWLILFPITISAFLFGIAKREGLPAWETTLNWWTTGQIPWVEDWQPLYSLFLISPLHLWFLYALLWFYMGAIVFRQIGKIGKGAIGRGVNGLFRRLTAWHLLLPAGIGFTTLTLLISPLALFDQSFPVFLPNPLPLIQFGPFFAFGWLLYRNVDLLPSMARWPVPTLVAAALMLVVYFGVTASAIGPDGRNSMRLETAAVSSAIAWLAVFGFIGLFLRYFNRPSPAMRYVSDSAYWVYLAHLPLIYWMQGLLFDLPVPALVKIGIILSVSIVVLYASYDLIVRPGVIGRFLNGRSYPSARLGLRSGTSPTPEPSPN
ncbi:acyltransferase family protein [Tautonia rosea]|uniref:acyltransferase family protein n=1 Tax=Tautonia rosea TaxID=2728037 RepID=UPI001474AB03|nr:acyltransferase family protein [Tautonia rosea]